MWLALRTGIPAHVWAEEGERAIRTAVQLLEHADDQDQDAGGDGRLMSG